MSEKVRSHIVDGFKDMRVRDRLRSEALLSSSKGLYIKAIEDYANGRWHEEAQNCALKYGHSEELVDIYLKIHHAKWASDDFIRDELVSVALQFAGKAGLFEKAKAISKKYMRSNEYHNILLGLGMKELKLIEEEIVSMWRSLGLESLIEKSKEKNNPHLSSEQGRVVNKYESMGEFKVASILASEIGLEDRARELRSKIPKGPNIPIESHETGWENTGYSGGLGGGWR